MNFSTKLKCFLIPSCGVSLIGLVLLLSNLLSGCGSQQEMKSQPNDLVENYQESSELSNISTVDPRDEVEPNSYIVMFRAKDGGNQLTFSSFFDEYKFHSQFISASYLSDPRVKKIQFITSQDLSPVDSKGQRFSDFNPTTLLKSLWDSGSHEPMIGRMARMDFVDQDASFSFLKEADDKGAIWFAEPNYVNKLMDNFVPEKIGWEDTAKSYEAQSDSWMKAIFLPDAMKAIAALTTKPSDDELAKNPPLIAVLDTGLDYDHPGLAGRVWENGAIGAAGCTDDLHGCDTSSPEPGTLGNGRVYPCGTNGPGEDTGKTAPECSHGTHVSGIIAGNYSSGRGGVCPVCEIMTLKVVELQGNKPKVLDSAILTGMKYLNRFRRNGNSAVRVINSSFGKFSRSRSVGILVDVLKRDGKGIILVGAAGNEDSMSRVYPAAFSEAIAVSALYDEKDGNNNGKKAQFSNFGPWVDIAAPGFKINSTMPGNSYDTKSGTSMAAPVVAGALGLYLAVNPNATADELKSNVLKTADGGIYAEDYAEGYNNVNYFKKISGESFRRPLLGAGLLDVSALIAGKVSDAYIGTPVDRVTPGCGTIAKLRSPFSTSVMVILLALTPLLILMFQKKKTKR